MYKVEPYRRSVMNLLPIANAWKEECNGGKFNIETDPYKLLNDFSHLHLFVLYEGELEIGVIGCEIFMNPLGTELIAQEKYWYVLPDKRGKHALMLMDAIIKWAKDRGCRNIMFSASMLASELHDSVCKIYERKKMQRFETTYILHLGG